MKAEGLSIGKIIGNNFRMAGAVFRADAVYVGFTLLVRTLSAAGSSFLYVYLLGAVLYCVENGKEPGRILLFLLAAMAFLGAVYGLESYYAHVFEPVHRERIVSGLQRGSSISSRPRIWPITTGRSCTRRWSWQTRKWRCALWR